jgi:hypothetical protein
MLLGRRGRQGRACDHLGTAHHCGNLLSCSTLLPCCCLWDHWRSCCCWQHCCCGFAISGCNRSVRCCCCCCSCCLLTGCFVAVAVTAAAAAEGAAAAAASVPTGAGPHLEHSFSLLTQAILLFFSRSRIRTMARHLMPCWAAECELPWAHMLGGLSASEVELEELREKSKRSTPPHPEHHPGPSACSNVYQILFYSSMWEVAGSSEGVAVVVVADPRQVYPLLLTLSLLHKWWQVSGCLLILTPPCYRRKSGGRGGGGSTAIGNDLTPWGMYYTDEGLHHTTLSL